MRVLGPDEEHVRGVRLQVVDRVRLGRDAVSRNDPAGLQVRAEALDGVADER